MLKDKINVHFNDEYFNRLEISDEYNDNDRIDYIYFPMFRESQNDWIAIRDSTLITMLIAGIFNIDSFILAYNELNYHDTVIENV